MGEIFVCMFLISVFGSRDLAYSQFLEIQRQSEFFNSKYQYVFLWIVFVTDVACLWSEDDK